MTNMRPQVNINGSSAESLIVASSDVLVALRALGIAMGHAVPHGRDYQTVPDCVYESDRDEFLRRIELLSDLESSYRADIVHLLGHEF